MNLTTAELKEREQQLYELLMKRVPLREAMIRIGCPGNTEILPVKKSVMPVIVFLNTVSPGRTNVMCGKSMIGSIEKSLHEYCACPHFIYNSDDRARFFKTYEEAKNFILLSFREYWDNLELEEL